jgi:hypothetical protein
MVSLFLEKQLFLKEQSTLYELLKFDKNATVFSSASIDAMQLKKHDKPTAVLNKEIAKHLFDYPLKQNNLGKLFN